MTTEIQPTTSELSRSDRWDHFLARIGYKRPYHRVKPGLYSLGNPKPESPVFVSANYTLSFDSLRGCLKGIDCYILVIDTKGINVWCAAGKGSFGTDEVVSKIESTKLKEIVSHRRIILPQLSAPGVAAHEVKKRTGFAVEYGPVRAEDLPEFLRNHKASEEMRRVRFNLKDRAILVPVEMKNNLLWAAALSVIAFFVVGIWPTLMILTIFLAGVILFPLMLPVLPSKDFSSKGLFLGLGAGLVFGIAHFVIGGWSLDLLAVGYVIADALLIAPWVSFFSLSFTGCSTYTSRTGVRKEIFKFIPIMAAMFIVGAILMALLIAVDLMG